MAILSSQEIDQRAAVVKEALSWCRTPYRHQADVKGAGCDCGMLLVRVYVDCGLIAPVDPRPYSNDWYLHQSAEKYMAYVLDRAVQVERPLFGDAVLVKYGRTFSHGGIVVGWPLIVHASAPAGCVLMEDIEKSPYAERDRRFFSYWGKAGR